MQDNQTLSPQEARKFLGLINQITKRGTDRDLDLMVAIVTNSPALRKHIEKEGFALSLDGGKLQREQIMLLEALVEEIENKPVVR